MLPFICSHLQHSSSLPCAGMPVDNQPHWFCPSCFATHCAELLQSADTTPHEVARLAYVEAEHLSDITLALHSASVRAKSIDSRTSNRLNLCKRKLFALNTVKVVFRVGQDDNRGPSYKRTRIIPRLIEVKSLSGYNDVVAYNRQVTFA
jgi:hypothetical protein